MRAQRSLILSTALLGALALLASSCDDLSDTPPEALGRDGDGTLQVSVDTGALELDTSRDLTLRLDVAVHGQAEALFSDARPLATLTPFLIHLAPGSYDITAEVIDMMTSEILYAGSASEVSVTQGELTGLTLTLQASGGVQILVELAAGGQHFTEVVGSPVDLQSQQQGMVRGSITRHRDANGDVRYWFFRPSLQAPYWRFYVADTAAELAGMSSPTYTDDAFATAMQSYTVSWSIAFAGDDLFILRQTGAPGLELYRWNQRTQSVEFVSEVPLAYRHMAEGSSLLGRDLAPNHFPSLTACALDIQRSFRVVCALRVSATGDPHVKGFVATESVDGGVTWSAMPPYADDTTTIPTFLGAPWEVHHAFTSLPQGMAIVTQAGVTRVFGGHYQSQEKVDGADVREFNVAMRSTVDWQHWTSSAAPVLELDPSPYWRGLLGVMPSGNTASDPGAWSLFYAEHHFSGSPSRLGHATSD